MLDLELDLETDLNGWEEEFELVEETEEFGLLSLLRVDVDLDLDTKLKSGDGVVLAGGTDVGAIFSRLS